MSIHAAARRNENFEEKKQSSLTGATPYIHASFHEAEGRGAEPAILRQMGERLMSEFIFSCRQNSIESAKLSDGDLKDGIQATLKGMVNPSKEQYASANFDSFREFYKVTREDFKGVGARVAERHTQGLIDTLQATQKSSLLSSSERVDIENKIVNEARVAASAYRSAGMAQRHVLAMFKDNTDVAGSPIISRIEKAIDDDGVSTMTLRANAAKEEILSKSFQRPKPSWASPGH